MRVQVGTRIDDLEKMRLDSRSLIDDCVDGKKSERTTGNERDICPIRTHFVTMFLSCTRIRKQCAQTDESPIVVGFAHS